MASANIDVIIGAVTSARPLQPDGVSQLSWFVKVEVKPMAFPGKLGTLGWGWQLEWLRWRDKTARWISTATFDSAKLP